MARAKKGVYKYLSLKNRVGNARIPKIKLVDLASSYKMEILFYQLNYKLR